MDLFHQGLKKTQAVVDRARKIWERRVWGDECRIEYPPIPVTLTPQQPQVKKGQLRLALVRNQGRWLYRLIATDAGTSIRNYLEPAELSALQTTLAEALAHPPAPELAPPASLPDQPLKTPSVPANFILKIPLLPFSVMACLGAGLLLGFGSRAAAIWMTPIPLGLGIGVLTDWSKYRRPSNATLAGITGLALTLTLGFGFLGRSLYTGLESIAMALGSAWGWVTLGALLGVMTQFSDGLRQFRYRHRSRPWPPDLAEGFGDGAFIGFLAALITGLFPPLLESPFFWHLTGLLITGDMVFDLWIWHKRPIQTSPQILSEKEIDYP